MTLCTRIAKVFGRQDCCFAIDKIRVIQEALTGGRRKSVVVGFDNVEKRLFRMADEFPWGVGQRNRFLKKIITEFLNREDSVIQGSAPSTSRSFQQVDIVRHFSRNNWIIKLFSLIIFRKVTNVLIIEGNKSIGTMMLTLNFAFLCQPFLLCTAHY